jgi:hypothetical protein
MIGDAIAVTVPPATSLIDIVTVDLGPARTLGIKDAQEIIDNIRKGRITRIIPSRRGIRMMTATIEATVKSEANPSTPISYILAKAEPTTLNENNNNSSKRSDCPSGTTNSSSTKNSSKPSCNSPKDDNSKLTTKPGHHKRFMSSFLSENSLSVASITSVTMLSTIFLASMGKYKTYKSSRTSLLSSFIESKTHPMPVLTTTISVQLTAKWSTATLRSSFLITLKGGMLYQTTLIMKLLSF